MFSYECNFFDLDAPSAETKTQWEKICYRVEARIMRRNRKTCILLVSQTLFLCAVWILTSNNTNKDHVIPKIDIKTSTSPHQTTTRTNTSRNTSQEDTEEKDEAREITTTVCLLYIPNTNADGLQNILIRKAVKNELSVALPRTGQETMCIPQPFDK